MSSPAPILIAIGPALCACIALTGCALTPTWGRSRKDADVASVQKTAPASWSAGRNLKSSAATGWLDDFTSSKLKSLVNQAVTANHDLKAAGARVEQARAQARVAGADLYPRVSGDFQGSRSQRASGQRFVGTGVRTNRFELAADIAWELDLWGRLRDQQGAAAADADAAAVDYHAARLSLAANTVKSAITLAEAMEQIRLGEENVNTRRLHLDVLEKQLDRGIDPDRAALDVSLSRSDLARAESTLASRKRDADGARRSLETLLGEYPAGEEKGMASLPEVRRDVPAGLPSELLLRRPDMVALERRLEAALRNESAAKKAFLPSFNLTTSGGYSTEELSRLIGKEALVWSLAGSVAQVIFDGGRIKANAELARSRYDEALENYASGALTAFQEVETALAAEAYLREQEAALARASSEAETARRLALGQYERGLADVLTLLDAQQRLFDAQSSLITVKALRLRNRADLHLALGGDF